MVYKIYEVILAKLIPLPKFIFVILSDKTPIL